VGKEKKFNLIYIPTPVQIGIFLNPVSQMLVGLSFNVRKILLNSIIKDPL
jgi:hypothetical protein